VQAIKEDRVMLWEVVGVDVIGVALPRDEVKPYLTKELAGSSVVQVMVAVLLVTVAAVSDITGGVVSEIPKL